MKIKLDNLWKYTGIEVYVDSLATEYLPKGVYTFVEKGSDGELRLYNKTEGSCAFEEYDEETEVGVNFDFYTPESRLKNLIEAQSAVILDLINDGWCENENVHFKLTPELEKLKSYQTLSKILNDE